jgi:hypothetical protein
MQIPEMRLLLMIRPPALLLRRRRRRRRRTSVKIRSWWCFVHDSHSVRLQVAAMWNLVILPCRFVVAVK